MHRVYVTASLLALAAPAFAADVTVSPGDDLNALTASLIAGDTVTFTAGTYELDGTLQWSGLGTDVQPIRFVAEGEVVLRNNGGGYVANVSDSDWMEIRGLIFEGAGDIEKNNVQGLRVVNATNVTVEDCVIRSVNGSGLRMDGDTNGITLRRNEVGPSLNGGGIVAGVGNGSAWMQDSTVVNNHVHDVGGAGLLFFPGTQAVTIEDNVVYRTGGDGLVLPDTAFGDQNVAVGNAIWQTGDDGIDITGSALVQSNVVFETDDDGIVTNDNDGSLVDVQISHNTVARTNGWAAELNGWYDADQMVFANNALANPIGRSLSYDDRLSDADPDKPVDDTANFIANNVVTGFIDGFDPLVRPSWVIEGGGVGDFADIDNFDYYPAATSLLRNTGSPDGQAFIPATDFNGQPRAGGAPSVGAYEFDGPTNPGWVIQEGFKGGANGFTGDGEGGGCCGGNDNGTQALFFGPLLLLGALGRRRED